METASWIFWGVWAGAGAAFELYAVRNERRNGSLPLTRVLRDRLMRRSIVAKLGVMGFLAWLALHFLEPLAW